ncbi:MAG: hypothetical protein KKF44_11195 [Nanoarchaeota archaeon]|nr:hypothetical protein [Nanoarchaeota archaeon]
MVDTALEDRLVILQNRIGDLADDLPAAWLGAYGSLDQLTESLPRLSEMQLEFISLKGLLQAYVSFYDELTVTTEDFFDQDISILSFITKQQTDYAKLKSTAKQDLAREGRLKDGRTQTHPTEYLEKAEAIVDTTEEAVQMLSHGDFEDNALAFKKNFMDNGEYIGFVTQLKEVYMDLLNDLQDLVGDDYAENLTSLLPPSALDYVKNGPREYKNCARYDNCPMELTIFASNTEQIDIRIRDDNAQYVEIDCEEEEFAVPIAPIDSVVELLPGSKDGPFKGLYRISIPHNMGTLVIAGNHNNYIDIDTELNMFGRQDPIVTIDGQYNTVNMDSNLDQCVSATSNSLSNHAGVYSFRR